MAAEPCGRRHRGSPDGLAASAPTRLASDAAALPRSLDSRRDCAIGGRPRGTGRPRGPGPASESARPWRGRLAILLAVVAALEALGILYFGTRGDPRFALDLNFISVGFFGTIVLFAAVGALIVVRRPSTRLAWVMIVMAVLFGAGLLAGAYGALYVTPSGGNAAPFAFELALLSGLLFVPTLAFGTTLLLLLYPTDTVPGPRWRIVALVAALGAIVWNTAIMFQPGFIENDSLVDVPNPLGAPAGLARCSRSCRASQTPCSSGQSCSRPGRCSCATGGAIRSCGPSSGGSG